MLNTIVKTILSLSIGIFLGILVISAVKADQNFGNTPQSIVNEIGRQRMYEQFNQRANDRAIADLQRQQYNAPRPQQPEYINNINNYPINQQYQYQGR